MLLLFFLWLISVAAAWAIAAKIAEGRAELVVVHGVVWTTLVVGPMYACGLANVLTKGVVALTTTILSAAILVVIVRGADEEGQRTLRARLRSTLLIPFDALRISWRENGLLALTLLATQAYFLWQLVSAYYAPYWGDWDTQWYHEPIIAFSIQNHGFDVVPLPPVHQVINGYERMGEVTQTWFGLFGGRRVVDASNFMFIPMLVGAMHCIAARFTRDRAIPMAWAAALFLMPGTVRLLRSTMVDVEAAALLLAAIHFVTHPNLTRRRMVLFVLAITGAVGVKTVNLPIGGVACLLFAVRVVLLRRTIGWRWVLGLGVFGSSLVLGMIAFTHLRNWLHFKNPIWPIALDVPRYGIHWPGVMPYEGSIEVALPLNDLLDVLLARPYTVSGRGHIWHVDDYGFGITWVVMPIAVIACAAAPLAWLVRWLLGRLGGLPTSMRARTAQWATLVALFAAAGYKFSPEAHVPRYTLASVGCGFALCVWALSGERWKRAIHAVAFAAQLSSFLITYWVVEPRPWIYKPKELRDLIKTRYPQREEAKRFRAPVNEPVALAREAEIGPGDVVMFDESEVWPAMAFNNDFSNKVYWIDNAKDARAQIDEHHAKWVLTRSGTAAYVALTKPGSGFVSVGPIENEMWTTAFRRVP